MRFTVVPSGPRLWPRTVWRLGAPGLRIAYDGGSVGLRWFRPNEVDIPDQISEVTISYLAFSWGNGSEATFSPRPGVTVHYRASAWPWVAGKLTEDARG